MNITPHPLVPVPTPEELLAWREEHGDDGVFELLQTREERIRLAEEDPVDHGFPLPQQEKVEEILREKTECWIFGGNRSGKSFTSAKMVMKALMLNPGTTIICWSQNQDSSVEMQMPYLHLMLPSKWQWKYTEGRASINYNEKTGFTGNKFVLPNGSKCLFRFYSQFLNNEKLIEGFRLGLPESKCGYLNIGSWPDEYYMDEKLIKRLYRRCNDNNAKIIVSFTPLDGYTSTVKRMLSGAETKETMYASLLKREMPYIMQPKKKSAAVVFFHTERNPFTNWDRMREDLVGESEDEIKTIAYGYPTKSITTNFPLFSENVHVTDKIPRIAKETHTVYQVIDPADSRNFFCIWAAVDGRGNISIIREWPDRDTYGPWALAGSASNGSGEKWKIGPAANKIGYAVRTDVEEFSYVKLFEEIESQLGVEVFERIGDSRFMATEHGVQDMFSDFADKGMLVVPSDGRDEKSGIQLVDQWFAYNPNIEIDSINKPKIMIHESCGNLIESIVNYNPSEGKSHESLKDPIDCLRYLRTANAGEGPEHYPDGSLGVVRGTKGGY